MANGLFIPSFRGPGSPGTPGAGSTVQGIQAGQLGEIQLGQVGEQAERASLIRGAQDISLIQSREAQLANLTRRDQEIRDRGGNNEHTQEGIQLLQEGIRTDDFTAFDESINDIIAFGREQSRPGGASARAFAPDTIRKVVGTDEDGNDVFGLFSRQLVFDPNNQTSKVVETRIEGDLVTATGETVEEQRKGKVETAKNIEESKVIGKVRGKSLTAEQEAENQAKVKGTVAQVLDDVKTSSRIEGVALSNKRAFDTYNTAVKDLSEKLGLTTTGVFSFPIALTDNQRIAEGAMALMPPLLKDIFRGAGEGTFTEGDQKILIDMLPTRRDSPAVRASKLGGIDAIVRSKLGQDPLSKPQDAVQDAPAMFSTVLGRDITEEDIQHTLGQHPGTTREQVIEHMQNKLGVR